MEEAEIVETEVEKAAKVLATAEKEKQESFAKEINEVCEKHGYVLDVVSQIVIKKK